LRFHPWSSDEGYLRVNGLKEARRNLMTCNVTMVILTEAPMAINDGRPCPFGSGLTSHWKNDARGILLARVCLKCEAEKLSGYRPEVLTDSNYEADEDIDGD
jgi:hypothetical protein